MTPTETCIMPYDSKIPSWTIVGENLVPQNNAALRIAQVIERIENA